MKNNLISPIVQFDETLPSKYWRASVNALWPTFEPMTRPSKSSGETWIPPQMRDAPAWSAAS